MHTFGPILASAITSLFLTFVSSHVGIFSSFSEWVSTAAFAPGLFFAWGIGIIFVHLIVVTERIRTFSCNVVCSASSLACRSSIRAFSNVPCRSITSLRSSESCSVATAHKIQDQTKLRYHEAGYPRKFTTQTCFFRAEWLSWERNSGNTWLHFSICAHTSFQQVRVRINRRTQGTCHFLSKSTECSVHLLSPIFCLPWMAHLVLSRASEVHRKKSLDLTNFRVWE